MAIQMRVLWNFDTVKSSMEEKADIFARDTLIARDYYKDFVQSEK